MGKRSSESDSFRRACPRAGGGIHSWAVFPWGSAHEGTPNAIYRVWEPNRLRRTSQVYAPLPAAPLRVGVGMRDRRRVRA